MASQKLNAEQILTMIMKPSSEDEMAIASESESESAHEDEMAIASESAHEDEMAIASESESESAHEDEKAIASESESAHEDEIAIASESESESAHEDEIAIASESESESEQGSNSGSEFAVSEESSSSNESSEFADEVPVPHASQGQADKVPLPSVGVSKSAQAERRGHKERVGRPQPVPAAIDSSWVIPNMVQPVRAHFTGTPGCTVDTTNFAPIDYFQLFLGDQFFMEMVVQTNAYAAAYLNDHATTLRPKSKARRWLPTDVPEMRRFWGLSILMGLAPLPNVPLYWSNRPFLIYPIFPAIMSRDRFILLQSMLHFNDNTAALPKGHADHDCLFKVRPVLGHFEQRFATIYVPNQNLLVDEPLVLFKGRLLFNQHVPNKHSQYGLKLYMLTESDSGYVYSFRVCPGKGLLIDPPLCPATLSITERIVWDLSNALFHMGYNLYLDKFYTDINLLKELYTVGTLACGIIRSTLTDFPKQLVYEKLERGKSSALRSEQSLALKYHEKRDVYVLSTIHDESTQPVTVSGKVAEVQKPTCILDCNKHMSSGVDKIDQLLKLRNSPWKTCKWYKKLVAHLMDLAMLNAFVVYTKTTSGKKMTRLEFEISVVDSLIEVETVDLVVAGLQDADRLLQQHFVNILRPKPKNDFPCKRCMVCSRQGILKETRYYCPQCPSKPGLCVPTCFKLYHTKVKFWEP